MDETEKMVSNLFNFNTTSVSTLNNFDIALGPGKNILFDYDTAAPSVDL